jgi:hypothetical protein
MSVERMRAAERHRTVLELSAVKAEARRVDAERRRMDAEWERLDGQRANLERRLRAMDEKADFLAEDPYA